MYASAMGISADALKSTGSLEERLLPEKRPPRRRIALNYSVAALPLHYKAYDPSCSFFFPVVLGFERFGGLRLLAFGNSVANMVWNKLSPTVFASLDEREK